MIKLSLGKEKTVSNFLLHRQKLILKKTLVFVRVRLQTNLIMARCLVRRRGHLLATCHRERSVAIYWQGDCRAVYSTRLAMTRGVRQVYKQLVMARGLVPRGHL
jgi:hypothetical protein